MDQRQQNRQSRNKALNGLLDKNAGIWQALQPFANAAADLRTATHSLDAIHQQQKTVSTGATRDKDALQEEAVRQVLALANNTAAYALDQRDNTLYGRVHFSKHYLLALPDNEQDARLRDMLAAVQASISMLAPYNVTHGLFVSAMTAVDAAADALPAPRGIIGERSAATKSIPALESAARHAIARMDKLVHNFEEVNSRFVGEYRQMRVVVDSGVRHEG